MCSGHGQAFVTVSFVLLYVYSRLQPDSLHARFLNLMRPSEHEKSARLTLPVLLTEQRQDGVVLGQVGLVDADKPPDSASRILLRTTSQLTHHRFHISITMKGIWWLSVHLEGTSFQDNYALARIILDIILFVCIVYARSRLSSQQSSTRNKFWEIRYGADVLILYVFYSLHNQDPRETNFPSPSSS